MGKAAKISKVRTCHFCRSEMYTDSKGLRDHFKLCVRAFKAGLVLPGQIEQPRVRLVGGRGDEQT